MNTPREDGFHFPAEFEPQEAMWLSWPHKEESWPGKIDSIYPVYSRFIKLIAEDQRVCINVQDDKMQNFATQHLLNASINLKHIRFYHHPTNDAWCRDHGPAFVVNRKSGTKAIVDWGYNAWGNKYPPFDLDDDIPTHIAHKLNLPVYYPGIVMEGGSVEFNGKGTVLTTTACLLNKNRNPHLSINEIEKYLIDYYGMEQVLWLNEGIVGDDTDGHIDDITRFVNNDTVVTVVEHDKRDENYHLLKENTSALNKMRLHNGKQLNVIEMPMPKAVLYEGQRLPASYANFYIGNKKVIVPTYRDEKNDAEALDILSTCFKNRTVIGLDSTDLIWGLGSFHCLSQQEPAV